MSFSPTHRVLVLLALVCGGVQAEPASAPPGERAALRLVLSNAGRPPLAEFQGEQLRGGVMREFVDRLSQQLGQPVQLRVVPRRRMELLLKAGEADLACFAAPRWWDEPAAFDWGEQPALTLRDVLVGASGQAPVTDAAQLPPGTPVLTVHGYRYPTLEPLFASGRWRRVDAPDEERQLAMLRRARAPYAVLKGHVHRWALQQPGAAGVADWQLQVDATPVSCAASKAPGSEAAAVHRAVARVLAAPGFRIRLAALGLL